MVAHEPELAPGLRPWMGALALCAVLYALVVVVVEWDFLPWIRSYPLDTRWVVCSSVDKLDELQSALDFPASFRNTLALLGADLTSVQARPDFNLLPKLLIWLAASVLPSILAYNLLVLATWVGNGVAVAALVLQITRMRAPALLAGFLFAFSPFWFAVLHCRSLDYGLFLLVPLTLSALFALRRRWSWVRVLWLAVLGASLLLSQQYYAFGLVLVALPWLIGALLGGPLGDRTTGRGRLILGVLVAAVGAALLLSPWLIIEWRMLAVQHVAVTVADDNAGRSFFQPMLVSGVGGDPILGLVWTGIVATLALVGALAGPKRWRLERGVLGLGIVALVLAQHGISSHVQAVSQFLWDLPVLWRVRSCRLFATLVVFLGATMAGVGLASVLSRVRVAWGRWCVIVLVTALCGLSLARADAWWKQGCVAHVRTLWFPEDVLDRITSMGSPPHMVVLPRFEHKPALAQSVESFLELRTGVPLSPPSEHDALRARLRDGGSLDFRNCTLLVIETGMLEAGGDDDAMATLERLGFSDLLFQDLSWTIAYTKTCSSYYPLD